jgi:hypothetical protein
VDDGLLIIDVFNPAWVLTVRQANALYHEFTKYKPESHSLFSFYSSYIAGDSLIYWQQFFEELAQDGGVCKHFRQMTLKRLSREEMVELVQTAKFEIESARGWYDGRPATPDFNNLILTLRKK